MAETKPTVGKKTTGRRIGPINKVKESEFIIGTMFALLVWITGLVLELFGIGLVLSPIIESFFTFGTWLFFEAKGDPYAYKFGANLVQYLANAIPFIPSILIAFMLKTYIHNHPEKFAALQKMVGAGTKV
jgi:hypothetical protein